MLNVYAMAGILQLEELSPQATPQQVFPPAQPSEPFTESDKAPNGDRAPLEKPPLIPKALQALDQWVVWRSESRDNQPKPAKRPLNPKTGKPASVSNPATWGSFIDALAALQKTQVDGLGFVFTDSDPFVGIDLDECRNPETGEIEPWALDIIERLNSYTEASPSGTGVHILTRGKLPAGGRKAGQIEMYETARFFTATGAHITGTPTTCEERTEAITDLYRQYFPAAKPSRPQDSPQGGRRGRKARENSRKGSKEGRTQRSLSSLLRSLLLSPPPSQEAGKSQAGKS
jgi:primase-polymerase (primpol)-like protein